jgi:TRAP-type C4-dicarboxylate transport system permease small subunit
MLYSLGSTLLANEALEHTELPMPAIAYALIAMGALLTLMIVTLSFSNVRNRHEAVEEHIDPHKQHVNNHDHGEANRH